MNFDHNFGRDIVFPGAMAYVDEEEALSFNVWVAELELLVGNARGNRRIDPIYSFDLLQKLQGSISRSERSQLQSYQRKCEDALTTVLLKGVPPPVGRPALRTLVHVTTDVSEK